MGQKSFSTLFEGRATGPRGVLITEREKWEAARGEVWVRGQGERSEDKRRSKSNGGGKLRDKGRKGTKKGTRENYNCIRT